jgi:hypothetical protein
VLLLHSYLAKRLPLLFWSSVCFTWLALNNVGAFRGQGDRPETSTSGP